MKSNVDKILKMVEEKKITSEEAVKLLESLNTTKSTKENFEEEAKEKCKTDDFKDRFKKFEESFGKVEIEIDKVVTEALFKISDITKGLAEKMEKAKKNDNYDSENEEREEMYEDMFDDLQD